MSIRHVIHPDNSTEIVEIPDEEMIVILAEEELLKARRHAELNDQAAEILRKQRREELKAKVDLTPEEMAEAIRLLL